MEQVFDTLFRSLSGDKTQLTKRLNWLEFFDEKKFLLILQPGEKCHISRK
jgi:hypothetical protein